MGIPEHPVIRSCEKYGYPYGAEEEIAIKCPICMKEADEFLLNKDEEIVGCNNCITYKDAFEWIIEHEEDNNDQSILGR